MRRKQFIFSSILVVFVVSVQVLFAQPTNTKNANIELILEANTKCKLGIIAVNSKKAEHLLNDKAGGDFKPINVAVDSAYLPGELLLWIEVETNVSGSPILNSKSIILTEGEHISVLINSKGKANIIQSSNQSKVFNSFLAEEQPKLNDLRIMESVLFNYSFKDDQYYLNTKKYYKAHVKAFNDWVLSIKKKHASSYVGQLFPLSYYVQRDINTNTLQTYDMQVLGTLKAIDVYDESLLNSYSFQQYVEYISKVQIPKLVKEDSLRSKLYLKLSQAINTHFKNGNPKLYGWLTDKLYQNSFAYAKENVRLFIQNMAQEPNCLVSHPALVKVRETGFPSLQVGHKPPNIVLKQDEIINNPLGTDNFNLYNFSNKPYTLVLFWSSQCVHCTNYIHELNQLMQSKFYQDKIQVVTLCVDTDKEDIAFSKKIIHDKSSWINALLENGLQNKSPLDFVVQSTPSAFLIINSSLKIDLIPKSMEELVGYFMLAEGDKIGYKSLLDKDTNEN